MKKTFMPFGGLALAVVITGCATTSTDVTRAYKARINLSKAEAVVLLEKLGRTANHPSGYGFFEIFSVNETGFRWGEHTGISARMEKKATGLEMPYLDPGRWKEYGSVLFADIARIEQRKGWYAVASVLLYDKHNNHVVCFKRDKYPPHDEELLSALLALCPNVK